jgi:hypothetical protein
VVDLLLELSAVNEPAHINSPSTSGAILRL